MRQSDPVSPDSSSAALSAAADHHGDDSLADQSAAPTDGWLELEDNLTTADPEEAPPAEFRTENYEFSVYCPICSTGQCASSDQIGRKLSYPDGYTEFPVHPALSPLGRGF